MSFENVKKRYQYIYIFKKLLSTFKEKMNVKLKYFLMFVPITWGLH
jgi:hypothetical protein